jgi:hypothetical protein
MRRFLNNRYANRWLWLCPLLSIVLAATVLMLFGFGFWGALLAALLLVCPALLLWSAIEVMLDERRQRAARLVDAAGVTGAPMRAGPFPLHHQAEVLLALDAARLFAHLDDPRRLASHMERPSLMTAGASMQILTDERQGQAVGSLIRMTGSVLGMHLSVVEAVTRRDPPREKVWETIGEPRLLVIGAYRMGFAISPLEQGSRLVVFIDYRLPASGVARALGWLLGRAYAVWCTRRVADDARTAFGAPAVVAGGR